MKNLTVKLLSLIIIASSSNQVVAANCKTVAFLGALIATAGAGADLVVDKKTTNIQVASKLKIEPKIEPKKICPKDLRITKYQSSKIKFDKRSAGNCARNR